MIEKIMRAVKSNNKKRGRNVTIGAVVGILLSCSAVMGADRIELEITKDGDKIIFKDKDGIFIPGNEKSPNKDLYPDNEWDGNTYTNNSVIYGTNFIHDYSINYTLKIDDNVTEMNFINNGMINSYNYSYSYGLHSLSPLVDITNNGVINTAGFFNSTGILSSTNNLINNGIINTYSYNDSYGIHIDSYLIGDLTNNGAIKASYTSRTNNNSYGISVFTLKGNLTNNGSIKSISDNGYGISINTALSSSNITNTGVVYGKASAIKINNGEVKNAVNYGILITDGSKAVEGLDEKLTNYGLIIKNANDVSITVTPGDSATFPINVIVGYDVERNPITKSMTIENKSSTNGNDPFSGDKTNYILNALKNTYKVIGTDDKVSGSIINSYENAVVFGTADKTLTLSGTIVNGGIKDGTVAILGTATGNNTLILEGADVLYTDGNYRFQQTIINGDINMQNGNNSVTLKNGSVVNGSITTGTGEDILNVENGSQINGILEGGNGDDILTFGKKLVTKSNSNNDEIRIHRNIYNFENINVNTNVTFYESTINNDTEKMESLKVTGVKELTIGENGILTLRIDSTNSSNTHALSTGNDGGTISSTGGKLLLSLNGAGNEETISFGGLTLDKSLVTKDKAGDEASITFDTTSKFHTIERVENTDNEVKIVLRWNLPDYLKYTQLNKIYHSIASVEDLIGNFNVEDDEKLSTFLGYLNDIYAGNPYSYSSELSRKSAGMFRDIVTENIFKPETNKWMIYGGLTHVDGGTKDTYYGKGYYTYDIGSSDMDAETKITGAYMLGEYGVSDTLTSGVVIGGNKLKSDLSNGSKVDGSAMYLGAYAKKYIGNLKLTAGAGFQYGDYDADRMAINRVASDSAESVMKYSDNYNDMTYDIYLNGRYSHNIGDNLFLEPYGTLSYTYVDQDGANEGSKALAIETDSKSFDYTVGKVGVDLKKVIPHSTGKSTLTAGVSYTKILDGAEEEYITGRFKGGSDFDIFVAHKNEHSIGLNAKYALELENGVLFDVKGTYFVERDSHNGSGKNKTKGEWIAGAGMGYKF